MIGKLIFFIALVLVTRNSSNWVNVGDADEDPIFTSHASRVSGSNNLTSRYNKSGSQCCTAHPKARNAPIASVIVVKRVLNPSTDFVLSGFNLMILFSCVVIRTRLFSYLETNKVHAISKLSPETGKLPVSISNGQPLQRHMFLDSAFFPRLLDPCCLVSV